MKIIREDGQLKKDNFFKKKYKKPKTLEEYFLLIGVDPIICTNKDLYMLRIDELNKNYSNSSFKPKILSKFPPVNKTYINIDETVIDICFPEGYKLLNFDKKPQPTFQHFILDNSFFSIEYPLKYVTCFKIYESLQQYYLLNEQMLNNNDKKESNNHNNNLEIDEINTGCSFTDSDIINKDFKNYYFPKILCLVSTQNFFEEEEEISILF